MKARADLSSPRPWRAEPETPDRPSSPWKVVDAKGRLVASMLSEEDALAIAQASAPSTNQTA